MGKQDYDLDLVWFVTTAGILHKLTEEHMNATNRELIGYETEGRQGIYSSRPPMWIKYSYVEKDRGRTIHIKVFNVAELGWKEVQR